MFVHEKGEESDAAPDKKASSKKVAPLPKLPTVYELARKYGEFIPAKPGCRWLQDRYSWRHAAADVRHGWASHRYHANEPMRLSDEDYLAALDAVSHPDGFRVHQGAVSPYCPHTDAAAVAAKESS